VITLAAAVVLHRDGPAGREVFLVRRGEERRFAGGWHAFPGGRLDPEDADVPVDGASGQAAALVACAARELLEEAGVLVARGATHVSAEALAHARRALLDGRLAFRALLHELGVSLDAGLLAPGARWVTPDHLPLRYDAQLYAVAAGPEARAEVWPGELSGGEFVPARAALARWERGELLLHPPNLWAIQVLAREGPVDLAALRTPPYLGGGDGDDAAVTRRVEFQGGFLLAALRTPTLPPATHTNAWLLELGGGLAVVDPGASDPAEQERLATLLDELAREGRPPREIWLTHGHFDHTGGVRALAERFGLPVRAHPAIAQRGWFDVPVLPLREGQLLHGRFLVLETPGHARDHVAFLDERSGAVICGDLVSTVSTIVVDPPDGEMAEYELQLARLVALAPRTLYPAHGPPAPNATGKLRTYLEHRRLREGLVVAALADGGTLEAITLRAYADSPAAALPVAERSCLAVLEKLERRGKARRVEGGWAAA
jgi:ribonuclease/clavin/mitogillin